MQQNTTIVGLSLVTTNEEAFNQQSIATLWQKFLSTPIKDQLPQVSSPSIFAVYSDYENEHHGKYKITLGFAVPENVSIPQGLSSVIIPAGNYQTFQSKSQDPTDIVATWKRIWEADPTALKRLYATDYEEYGENEMAIHISCK